jgi:hypothetical protein
VGVRKNRRVFVENAGVTLDSGGRSKIERIVVTHRARTILLVMLLGVACVLGGTTLTAVETAESVDSEDTSEPRSEIQSRRPRRAIERTTPGVIVERYTTIPTRVAAWSRVPRMTTRSLAMGFSARRLR